ncbi:MAG: DegT/DnrJ/EryC1/StrS aminotransferase family protein [Candidatus Altiarchaeota archaeon]|nr:DegT/DnrJ/EryC1/StrS aminotransferase family protein [Candidatus Altiarchaeota archaeon]
MIPVGGPSLGREEFGNLVEAFVSGWISSKGPFVGRFERLVAAYCGVRHAVSASNGTAALHLALKALGIGPGDEVIVPALSFISTANVVSYCGARPVFVDSHPDYWCMDPGLVQESITRRTKAIIPVHAYGHPCDMREIMRIARDFRLRVVEDCAEAIGSRYRGRMAGSFGDVGCFSFYANKTVTTGEGGMCVTNDRKLADKISVLKNYGMSPGRRYWHDVIGFNYRMTNLQAAIGVAQMRKANSFVRRKREIAKAYGERLSGVVGITLPKEMPWAKSSFWMYSVLVERKFGTGRDTLMKSLSKNGVETRPLLQPINLMPPYRTKNRFPVAESLSKRGVSLPSGVDLSERDLEKVCRRVANAGK